MNADPSIDVVVVCVDYADMLSVTLPRNIQHFASVTVVTNARDHKTIDAVNRIGHSKIKVVCTDAFYRNGAVFNKGAAINVGLQVANNGNWLAVMDADILLPHHFAGFGCVELEPGKLYVPHRRLLENPQSWYPDIEWTEIPKRFEEPGGWLQIFHASDPVLKNRPWYPDVWKHAGGCDSGFWMKWSRKNIVRISEFEVLHLGPDGKNWCGRATPMLDGTIHPDAKSRADQLKAFLDQRHRTRGPSKFKHERLDGNGGIQ